MKFQPKTLALLIVAGGLLASGYLIGPAPASTATTATAIPKPVAAPAPAVQIADLRVASPSKPAGTIKAMRPPVPLLVSAHSEYFVPPAGDAASATAQMPTMAAKSDSVIDEKGADLAAKAMIEQDGYRNVRALVKGVDGVWHGRALRGSTEIAVSVDASGSVSAN